MIEESRKQPFESKVTFSIKLTVRQKIIPYLRFNNIMNKRNVIKKVRVDTGILLIK